MTRGYAAFLLKISKTELIRREKDGIYTPIFDDKGGVWYDERLITSDTPNTAPKQKEIGKRPAQPNGKPAAGQGYSSEHAALVFAELNKGKALDEIVIKTKVHPEAVLAIADAYARIKGALLFAKADLEVVSRMPIRGAWPPANAKEFLVVLTASLAGLKCVKCTNRPARICASCATPPPIDVNGGAATYGKRLQKEPKEQKETRDPQEQKEA